jgi:hypothetical protein
VRLPHFQMTVNGGTRTGPLNEQLILRSPKDQTAQGVDRTFRATILKAG